MSDRRNSVSVSFPSFIAVQYPDSCSKLMQCKILVFLRTNKTSMSQQYNMQLPSALFRPSSKNKKNHSKKKSLYFRKWNFLTLRFLIFSQKKVFLYFRKQNPGTFSPCSKNKKTLFIFSKESFFYIPGNRNHEKFPYISGDGTFFIFQERTIQKTDITNFLMFQERYIQNPGQQKFFIFLKMELPNLIFLLYFRK